MVFVVFAFKTASVRRSGKSGPRFRLAGCPRDRTPTTSRIPSTPPATRERRATTPAFRTVAISCAVRTLRRPRRSDGGFGTGSRKHRATVDREPKQFKHWPVVWTSLKQGLFYLRRIASRSLLSILIRHRGKDVLSSHCAGHGFAGHRLGPQRIQAHNSALVHNSLGTPSPPTKASQFLH